MATLAFLLTVLILIVLIPIVLIKTARRKPVKKATNAILLLIGFYTLIWLFFYINSKYVTVPLGTDTCFDDWCATVTKIDHNNQSRLKLPPITKDSVWVVLSVTVSNHAKRIAQKPSEPRIHIVDDNGGYWPSSSAGQFALEKQLGQQVGIGQQLELGQSLSTQLVYKIPVTAKHPKVLIEEGPFITKLLFKNDELVYAIAGASR